MFEQITVVHYKKPNGLAPVTLNEDCVGHTLLSVVAEESDRWVKWETCLRQMFFGSVEDLPENLLEKINESESIGLDIYTGSEAYDFCLQTVCGLKSPMIGETEVWGQFKALFREFPFTDHPRGKLLQNFSQSIFSDAKAIRHRHLTGLGSQSYGSLARRMLKGSEEINIIGAGLLVKDMLPWLAKKSKTQIFSRRREQAEERVSELKIKTSVLACELDDLKEKQLRGSLIIAAPVSKAWLVENVDPYYLTKIIDLRDNSEKDSLSCWEDVSEEGVVKRKVVSLISFFKEIEETKSRLEGKIASANDEIKNLTEKRYYKFSKERKARSSDQDQIC